MAPSLNAPPADPGEYVAQLGRQFWREWEWHTAPAEVSSQSSQVNLVDYSFDLSHRLQMILQRQEGLSKRSAFDDNTAWADVSFGLLEDLTKYHAGTRTLKQAMDDHREYLGRVLNTNEIILFPAHPQYNNWQARTLQEIRNLAVFYAQQHGIEIPDDATWKKNTQNMPVDKVKVLTPKKKHVALLKWLLEKPERIEKLVERAQSSLVSPPKTAVTSTTFGFRRHVASLINGHDLTPEFRGELADKVVNQWGKKSVDDLSRSNHDVYAQLGIPNIFDTDDLRPVLGRLKQLAETCRGNLDKQIEAVCMQMLLKLAGDEVEEDGPRSAANREKMLADTANFWRNYLRESSKPLYEHEEFGLAYLAGLLHVNDKEDILNYIGAFEK